MIASGAASLIIECPHCATRYQLPGEALGPRGRRVQCANCGKAWRASPPPITERRRRDDLVTIDDAVETALDQSFVREERRVALPQPWAEETEAAERSIAGIRAALGASASGRPEGKVKSGKEPEAGRDAQDNAHHRDTDRMAARLASLNRHLPTARLRRGLRLMAGLVLGGLVAGLVLGRVEVVRAFPEMAGAYAAIGLPVNVPGIEFHDLAIALTREQGAEVLSVTADLVSVSAGRVAIPPVVVTLLGETGETLYRWSVTPVARALGPGEHYAFATRITTPPPGTQSVHLGFADGRAVPTGTQTVSPTGKPS
ncbi:MJ0042 family finger-like domain-containing protein [Devosia enhydra]|uniref:MJ0042 family finger-like domain-containing protein n=1 Tax=Devosia enhydra TaxID=665118 RepID=A0A1K2I080_9HYPH|nr:zinc-ribbon domain-containing protein [Devosia enhydra]SFZ85736.1 MJ0042 family finger-like domain-containing protein [Devosia enhydra]